MDGKYAKYINDFVQNFRITDQKVEITTLHNSKNKPASYDVRNELIGECNQKLESQYEIVEKNQEEIKRDLFKNKNKITKIIFAIAMIALVLFAGMLAIDITALIPLANILGIAGGSLGLIGAASMAVTKLQEKAFDQEMKIIHDYRENKEEIERMSMEDENVTKYLSSSAQKLLTEKQNQQKEIHTFEIFDIDFMDKLLEKKAQGRKDLKTLLNMYKTVISIAQEPTYRAPEVKTSKPKKLARIKKEKTNKK